jgi:hypothetical protein
MMRRPPSPNPAGLMWLLVWAASVGIHDHEHRESCGTWSRNEAG